MPLVSLLVLLLAAPISHLAAQTPAQAAEIQRLAGEGDRALSEGRYPDAQSAYEKLRKIGPGIAEIHAKLGVIYFQQGKFSEAAGSLRQALKLKPAIPNAAILLAASLSELGQFKEAIPGLEKGFRSTSDPALKRLCGLQLQRAYTAVRRDADAVQTALEMTRLYPNDPEILYHSGRLFGNYAYLNMSRLAEVAPDSVFRLMASGEAHESAGSFELAAKRYREAISKSPERPGLHLRLGRALLRAGQTDAAAEAFQRELAIDPSNGNAAYELAVMQRQAGDSGSKVTALFEAALRSDPDFEEAHIGLAKVLSSQEKWALALEHLRKAAGLNPENEVTQYLLVRVYRALGQTTEERKALAEFQRLRDRSNQRDALIRSDVTRQKIETGQ
jgi:tetratricopeptide (TPR) repeat protein